MTPEVGTGVPTLVGENVAGTRLGPGGVATNVGTDVGSAVGMEVGDGDGGFVGVLAGKLV